MIRLAAFADEISPDLDEQIKALEREGIDWLDLRSVGGRNVLGLDDAAAGRIRSTVDAHGIRVLDIGSPIGKVPIDTPADEELCRLDRAIELAQGFDAPFIRIFSFYPPASGGEMEPAAYRDEVLKRLGAMTERARRANVVLLHENERDIYGDTIARCVDLLETIDDAHFQAILDPANFVQCGQSPFPEGYEALRPWIRGIHVKDARRDGTVTVAGQGEAGWPALLERLVEDGFDGFFSLEPHLALAGRAGGFSGVDLFRGAAEALQALRARAALPPEVRDLVEAFVERLRSLLGENLHGVYLYGAIAFPDSRGQTQDIDFHVLVREPLHHEQRRKLQGLRADLARFGAMAEELDGYVVLLDDLGSAAPPRHQVWPLSAVPTDGAWALHCAHIRAGRSITLHGPAPTGLYPEPTWPDLKAALFGEARFVDGHIGDAPAFCVLNAVRLLYSFTTRDVVVSKRAAAEWGLDTLPPERHALIQAALRFYRREATAADHTSLAEGAAPFVASIWQRIADLPSAQ